MKKAHCCKSILYVAGCVAVLTQTAAAFEGRLNAVMIQGNVTNQLLYTAGTNLLRVEMTEANGLNPVDILDIHTGALTLLFPNNRSFVRLKSATEAAIVGAPGFAMPRPVMPTMPSQPEIPPMPNRPVMPNISAAPAMSSMPAMPIPMMPNVNSEFQATGQKTNILDFDCQRYELRQRGETLEIWATDQLPPFQPYLQSQPHRSDPNRMSEQWPGLLADRKLFPLRASLRRDNNGAERFSFAVQSVTPQKLTDGDARLFQPPEGYFEIQPLPF